MTKTLALLHYWEICRKSKPTQELPQRTGETYGEICSAVKGAYIRRGWDYKFPGTWRISCLFNEHSPGWGVSGEKFGRAISASRAIHLYAGWITSADTLWILSVWASSLVSGAHAVGSKWSGGYWRALSLPFLWGISCERSVSPRGSPSPPTRLFMGLSNSSERWGGGRGDGNGAMETGREWEKKRKWQASRRKAESRVRLQFADVVVKMLQFAEIFSILAATTTDGPLSYSSTFEAVLFCGAWWLRSDWKMSWKCTGLSHNPSQMLPDQQRNKTRVSIGSGFLRWSQLKGEKATLRSPHFCWTVSSRSLVSNVTLG